MTNRTRFVVDVTSDSLTEQTWLRCQVPTARSLAGATIDFRTTIDDEDALLF